MIGRTRRGASRAPAALLAAGCVLGAIGCAAGTTGPGAPVPPGGSSTGETTGSDPSGAGAGAGTGTGAPAPEGSTTVACDASRPAGPDPGGDPDLVVGPLSLPRAAHGIRMYGGTPAAPGPDGLSYYKIGVRVVYGATATVSIGAEARSFAGIRTERGRDGGYSAVTYSACASEAEAESHGLDLAGEATGSTRGFWVGGFLLTGRDSACLPLDITVDGDPTVHRVDLAMPAGACG